MFHIYLIYTTWELLFIIINFWTHNIENSIHIHRKLNSLIIQKMSLFKINTLFQKIYWQILFFFRFYIIKLFSFLRHLGGLMQLNWTQKRVLSYFPRPFSCIIYIIFLCPTENRDECVWTNDISILNGIYWMMIFKQKYLNLTSKLKYSEKKWVFILHIFSKLSNLFTHLLKVKMLDIIMACNWMQLIKKIKLCLSLVKLA